MILRRGQVSGDFTKEELPLEQLVQMMAGGADLEVLQHELEQASRKGEPTPKRLPKPPERSGPNSSELGEETWKGGIGKTGSRIGPARPYWSGRPDPTSSRSDGEVPRL